MDKEEIKKFRQSLGVTQAQLAKILGIRTNSVSRWEQGVMKPSPNMEKKLEKLFHEDDKQFISRIKIENKTIEQILEDLEAQWKLFKDKINSIFEYVIEISQTVFKLEFVQDTILIKSGYENHANFPIKASRTVEMPILKIFNETRFLYFEPAGLYFFNKLGKLNIVQENPVEHFKINTGGIYLDVWQKKGLDASEAEPWKFAIDITTLNSYSVEWVFTQKNGQNVKVAESFYRSLIEFTFKGLPAI